ncbi:sodium/calcium exchanger 1 [Dictyocaulus viviparus]|uniref:Sodium/calcium exchanger 1 n=1 Tax=Dictyocaulus viviparus TaxID=29172 RepID=A0A0D8XUR0_DICVI|nr:sodium/calcium exchanger 1 [Dictyocaulus viviparus]
MYIILAVTSPGEIEIWEGLLTFAFFPLTVITAWIADIKIIQNRFLPRRYRRGSHGMIATEGEEMKMLESNGVTQPFKDFTQFDFVDPAVRAFEEHRREFIELMREIRKKNPHISPIDLQKQAEYEMITRGPKSRAFYRVQATRRLIGGGDIVKKRIDKEHNKAINLLMQAQEKQNRDNTCKIFFDPAHYTVLENVGSFDVVVGRDGGPAGLTVMVDYYTEDGTANAGSDYIPVQGTLTFYPDDKHQKISIDIVDDDVFEEDEHFYLHLRNLRVRTKDGLILDPSRIGGLPVAQLEMPATATIMILDDDHAGVFSFEHDHFEIIESCGHLSLKVQRHSGARGKVIIPYRTLDGSAIGNKHFEAKTGELVFDDNQTEAFIELGVIDTEQYERSDHFFIELDPPIWAKKMSDLSKVQERFQRRMEQKRRPSVASESKGSSEQDYVFVHIYTTPQIPTSSRMPFCFSAKLSSVAEIRFITNLKQDTPALIAQYALGDVRTTASGLLKMDPAKRAVSASPNLNYRFKRRMGSWIAGMRGGDDHLTNLTADQLEVAELGKPRLGEFPKCQITIKESKEFQVCS